MTSMTRIVGIAALVAGLAAPAFAKIDGGALTCGEYFAMDAGGKAEAANALMIFVNDAANAGVAGMAANIMTGMDTTRVQTEIDAKCEGQAVDANIVSLIK